MATENFSDDAQPKFAGSSHATELSLWETIRRPLLPLTSLKLTVVLFALSILLVLFGTVAQWRKDIWDVIEQYFRTFFAFVEIRDLLPASFFPGLADSIPDSYKALGGMEFRSGFYFPGGWLIGGGLTLNLLSAHALRFKTQAKDTKLWAGLGVIVLGMLTTWMVIVSGSNKEGMQSAQLLEWSTLWLIFQATLITLWGAGLCRLLLLKKEQTILWWGMVFFEVLLGGLNIWLLMEGDSAQLSDPSMRILWQLIKASVAGLILLAGCTLVFQKRGGIVLLHGGVGLMMFGELLTGTSAIEAQMVIEEGETVNFVQDIRTFELAVIETSTDADYEEHTVIPKSVFLDDYDPDEKEPHTIQHDDLPFDVTLLRYLRNSNVRMLKPDEKTPSDTGAGLRFFAEEVKQGTGTDMGGGVDVTSAYLKLTKKGTEESLGTYLMSLNLNPQQVTVGDTTYDVALRFKHMYKPYSMNLIDVSKKDYIGTSKPKDYSSTVRLVDETRNVDREIHIWMNNPLRFAGETFYQSNYAPASQFSKETTTLQVVTNTGWMIPYVSCMLVAIGMLGHFWITLSRFLRRRATPASIAGSERSVKAGSSQPATQAEDVVARLKESQANQPSTAGWLVPLVVVLLFAGWVGGKARVPKASEGEFHLQEFGKLPVIYEGRVKPLDTLARTSLRTVSGKQTFTTLKDSETLEAEWKTIHPKLEKELKALFKKNEKSPILREDWSSRLEKLLTDFNESAFGLTDAITESATIPVVENKEFQEAEGSEKMETFKELSELQNALQNDVRKIVTDAAWDTRTKHPAIVWLLDTMARPDKATQHRVFEIRNPKIQQTLDLKPRKTALYSIEDLQSKLMELDKQAQLARDLEATDRSVYQKKILELSSRLGHYMMLMNALRPPSDIPNFPSQAEFQEDRPGAQQKLQAFVSFLRGHEAMVKKSEPPLLVPIRTSAEEKKENQDLEDVVWEPYSTRWMKSYVETQVLTQDPNPAFSLLNNLIVFYAKEDAAAFNKALDEYQAYLADNPPEELNITKTNFEAFFNHFEPFYYSSVLYIITFILAALAWLGWSKVLNRSAFCLILFTFGLHSAALIARMYISGRPPVTNLYSSAVFIGWGCVALGIIFELIFKSGVGNVVCGITGFATLLIAHMLATSDTLTVMQAVLDTQFWLATHVVTITLGYATTFMAGILGVIYIIRGMCTTTLTPQAGKELTRMIYGTLCFAIWFSFVGTVLGGLWADDSWGRFWGWDPKENGALIIVLWNALVLHARWGGMVKDRGLAALAVIGNIVTSWSWFGVNELGVGLHSYGFTEGVMLALGGFILSQLIISLGAALPKSLWLSFRK